MHMYESAWKREWKFAEFQDFLYIRSALVTLVPTGSIKTSQLTILQKYISSNFSKLFKAPYFGGRARGNLRRQQNLAMQLLNVNYVFSSHFGAENILKWSCILKNKLNQD